MRPPWTAISCPSPLECRIDADGTHCSTSSSATPSARWTSTRCGQGSPTPKGVRAPQGSAMRSDAVRSARLMHAPYPEPTTINSPPDQRGASLLSWPLATDEVGVLLRGSGRGGVTGTPVGAVVSLDAISARVGLAPPQEPSGSEQARRDETTHHQQEHDQQNCDAALHALSGTRRERLETTPAR